MSNVQQLQIQLVYLECLNRYPTTSEIAVYENDLLHSLVTTTQIKTYLQSTKEFLLTTGQYHGDFDYNPSSPSNTVYDIGLSNYPIDDSYTVNYDGVMLANGKIGIVTSSKPNDIEHCFVTTSFDFNSIGKYANNVIEAFNCSSYTLFEPTFLEPSVNSNISFSNVTQSLDMYGAVFTTSYDCQNASQSNLHVTSKMCALHQYPYCVMQTITIENPASNDVYLDFYHKIKTHEDATIQNVKYHNNVINHSKTNNTHFFQAVGDVVIDSETSLKLCANNCYLFNVSQQSDVLSRGYNVDRNNHLCAYNHFNVKIPASGNSEITILSCMMTDKDFKLPDIETNRILLNLLNKTQTELLLEHRNAWAKLWETRIVLEEKSTVNDVQKLFEVNEVKRMIYYSLYNIYSVVRDDINVEINPLNLSTLDINGTIFWNSELWLLPLLLFIKPKSAKSLLDFRYKQLENSKQLAAAHGFKGSKFPYQNDIIGYNNLYWDTISPLHIFNTALISISAWNYFRVTRDFDWLRSSGYKILKSNADFFQSKSEYDSSLNKYVIKDVIAYNNTQADNNLLTNYLAKLALRYAIEACYELNYVADSKWLATLDMYLSIESVPTNALYENASPSSSNLFVNLETVLGNDSYVFYDCANSNQISGSNQLGWMFGKYSGNYMVLDSNVDYNINLGDTLSNNPIMFCDFNGNELSPLTGSTALYTSNNTIGDGYYNGTFIASGNSIHSYKYSDQSYLNTFGYHAFTTNSNAINANDLLMLDSSYAGEKLSILEPFIVLHSYYSRHLFTLPTPQHSYNKDTLKDNVLFYHNRKTTEGENSTLNTLLEFSMYAMLSQDESGYDGKTSYLNSFYHLLKNSIQSNTTRPWYNWRKDTSTKQNFNDISLSSLFLLTMITSIGGLRISGAINESRYYTEEYGIKQRSAYVMPDTWSTLKFHNIGGNINTFTVYNTYF